MSYQLLDRAYVSVHSTPLTHHQTQEVKIGGTADSVRTLWKLEVKVCETNVDDLHDLRLLSLILPFDPLHQPSTTTSVTAMATGDTPGFIKPGDMIVSVTRRRNLLSDHAFTCQFPLSDLTFTNSNSSGSVVKWLRQAAFTDLGPMLGVRLDVSPAKKSIAGRLESDQLAIVNDRNSLYALIMNHQFNDKHVIQLYVVENCSKAKMTFRSITRTANAC